jgi:VWFA-related protein
MKRSKLGVAASVLWFGVTLAAQSNSPAAGAADNPETTLRVNSRAVLVDVIVTDRKGNPVQGLKQDAFTVTEQGKPQAISYFEEHSAAMKAADAKKLEFPTLPPNVFTNFSPIPTPPAVTVLLLDALNTPMSDQIYLRESAKHYLKTLKPGSRLAIFTMSLRLSFVQGFADDPAVLATALGYRKNDKSEPAVLLQSQEESNAQAAVVGMMAATEAAGGGAAPTSAASPEAIAAFQQFLQETRYAQDSDREYRTMQNLNQLATYLGAFPGRKNVIWMSGAFPLALFGQTAMRFDDSIVKTINLLAAARIAIYPVDVRGASTQTLYAAENKLDPTISSPSQMLGPPPGLAAGSPNAGTGAFASSIQDEGRARNASNSTMDALAQATGGKAFYNQNDLSGIIGKVVEGSSNFYTVSYTPTDTKMDGSFRSIDVKVAGGNYALSFRRGYVARDEDLPGSAQTRQQQALQHASLNPVAIDPLAAFMDFGLPQTDQILYKTLIQHLPPKPPGAADAKPSLKGPLDRYSVDFAIDLKDLRLRLDPDGLHKGTLNLSLVVYDKYGEIASREDHLVNLNIKPDVYAIFQKTGVQLHGEVSVPKGQYWLRTGVYDQASRKVGTMEVPLSSVKDLNVASK